MTKAYPVLYFPHEVSDLVVAVNYWSAPGPIKDPGQWALRYAVLLWLSLVCMLPFDLRQFDSGFSQGSGGTAVTLEGIAKSQLDKPGLERDGAALLLSRLYMRCVAIVTVLTVVDCVGRIHNICWRCS